MTCWPVLRARGIDALVSVGGDGTLSIAHELHRKGLRVVGVPKTIDNDLDKTFTTFGFDTAVTFATECLDRLHSTAESHQRIMVVEMMGRYAWLDLFARRYCGWGTHAILIPKSRSTWSLWSPGAGARCAGPLHIPLWSWPGRLSAREGQRADAGVGQGRACGAPGAWASRWRRRWPPHRQGCRVVVLGHLLRGGSPTAFDRLAALRFGTAAVHLDEGAVWRDGFALFPNVVYAPLSEWPGA